MSNAPATTIIRPDEKPWWPLPLAEGAFVKVLKVDPARNHVVFQFRFEPGCELPKHYHHARAVAYTMAGEWEYEEGKFRPGDVAYEEEGNLHTPRSDTGAELLIIFDGDGPKLIDNYMPDGRVLTFDVETFRLLEEGEIGAVLERLGLA